MADIITSTDPLAIIFSKNKVKIRTIKKTELEENSLIVGVDLSTKGEEVCYKEENQIITGSLKPYEFGEFLKAKKEEGNTLYVGMEACGGSNYWADVCMTLGHKPYIIAAEAIRGDKPKHANKSDSRDALYIHQAICNLLDGVREYPVVTPRSKENVGRQEIGSLRELLVRFNEKLGRHQNGFMRDITGNKHNGKKSDEIYADLEKTLDSEENGCDAQDKETIKKASFAILKGIEEALSIIDARIIDTVKNDEDMKIVSSIPGVGAIASYILVNAFGDISRFKDGRHASSCMGTAPKGEGTGGKYKVLNTQRKGIKKVKRVLYQSGMSFTRLQGMRGLKQRKQAAAYANRVVRIAYALLRDNKPFDDKKANKRMINVHKYTSRRLVA